MAKLKEEFLSATRERQVRFGANIVEEMAEAGKSNRKIRDYLEKIGADTEIISEAFELAEDEGIEDERSRAKRLAAELMGSASAGKCAGDSGFAGDDDFGAEGEAGCDPKVIRRVLSKLAYQGFDEEIIYEIAEGFLL